MPPPFQLPPTCTILGLVVKTYLTRLIASKKSKVRSSVHIFKSAKVLDRSSIFRNEYVHNRHTRDLMSEDENNVKVPLPFDA